MLDASVPTVTPSFSDREEIPAWAKNAVYAVSQLGVIDRIDNKISPLACVTRGDAAEILENFIEVRAN